MAHDLINYSNPAWLQQWLRLQEFRCFTWQVLLELFDEQ